MVHGVDIVITGDELDERLNAYVHIQFQMKDLDTLKYVLGIDIAQSTSNIVIS